MLVTARSWIAIGLFTLPIACGGGKGRDDADAEDTGVADLEDVDSPDATPDVPDLADSLEDDPGDAMPDGADVPHDPDTEAGEDMDAIDVPAEDVGADPDAGAEEIPDVVIDEPTEVEVVDAITDVPPDLPGDGDGSISGVVVRNASLSPGGTSDTDASGSIMVVLYSCNPFEGLGCATGPVGTVASAGPVDLGDPSAEFSWEFSGLAPGYYTVFAALDDDGSGFGVGPWVYAPAMHGDLATFPPEEVYVFTGSAVTGVVSSLDVRASRLSGSLTLGTGSGYTGDGTGDGVVGVADVDPSGGGPFAIMGLTVVRGIDLADGTPDSYETVLLAPAGTAYVLAYLDDDGSGGSPAHGDPAALPVPILAVPAMGSDLTMDLILDGLVP